MGSNPTRPIGISVLRVEHRDVYWWLTCRRLACFEDLQHALPQLLLPALNVVRMNVVPWRQLCPRYLCLKCLAIQPVTLSAIFPPLASPYNQIRPRPLLLPTLSEIPARLVYTAVTSSQTLKSFKFKS
jgi:hypothetical protein